MDRTRFHPRSFLRELRLTVKGRREAGRNRHRWPVPERNGWPVLRENSIQVDFVGLMAYGEKTRPPEFPPKKSSGDKILAIFPNI